MVALQHQQQSDFEVPVELWAVVAARRDLDRLQTGLPRALLASAPEAIRVLADRAMRAEAVVARRLALVGDRPELDAAAEAEALVAAAAYRDARAARSRCASHRQMMLAKGNGLALGCFSLAAMLQLAGLHAMSRPITLAVMAAATGPVSAVARAVVDHRQKTAAVKAARANWASALDAAGVPTMGALAARRVAVSGWERRRREAELAEQAAARHRRAWQRLAGPGLQPELVATVLERLVVVREAQLRLLAALLRYQMQSPVAPRVAVVAEPAPVLPPDSPPAPVSEPAHQDRGSWFEEAVERLRSRKSHHLWLWR